MNEGLADTIRRGREISSRMVFFCLIFFLASGAGCNFLDQARDEHGPGAQGGVRRILLIGLDGMEWDIVLPMLHQRELPRIAELMREGTFGELETLQPTLSPVIWTSIATGVLPSRHGIESFVHEEGDENGVQPLFTSRDRRVKAFWNILSDFNKRVVTVGWWMTFPAEKVKGVMVSQVNTTTRAARRVGKGIWKGRLVKGLEGQVYPPEREAEILQEAAKVERKLPELTREIFGEFSSPLDPVARQLWQHCIWAFRADATYRAVGRMLLGERAPFDLFAIYFGGTDVVGHRFWRYMEPERYQDKPAKEDVLALGQIISDYYIYIDGVVGELVDRAPRGTTVILVSDHGMGPINTDRSFGSRGRNYMLNSGGHQNSPAAFLVASGPGIRRSALSAQLEWLKREELPRLGSVLDVTPTLLALLRVPIGRDMVGKVLTTVVDPGFLGRHRLQFVDTHTPAGWYASRAKETVQTAGWIERLEQLRALGYIQ